MGELVQEIVPDAHSCGFAMMRAYLEGTTHLEGHGDLVSRLIIPISHLTSPAIPILNPVTP